MNAHSHPVKNIIRNQKIPERRLPVPPKNCPFSPRSILYLDTLTHSGRLVWELDKNQVSYIENVYKYKVYPYIYKIKTFSVNLPKNKKGILKKIHRNHKKGKKYIYISLNAEDFQLLDQLDINVQPYKFEIFR